MHIFFSKATDQILNQQKQKLIVGNIFRLGSKPSCICMKSNQLKNHHNSKNWTKIKPIDANIIRLFSNYIDQGTAWCWCWWMMLMKYEYIYVTASKRELQKNNRDGMNTNESFQFPLTGYSRHIVFATTTTIMAMATYISIPYLQQHLPKTHLSTL